MIPGMYHLNAAVLDRDLPFIGAYNRVFGPLHERLFTQAMIDFQILSEDRSLQRSIFEDGTRITVNFDLGNARQVQSEHYPAGSATVELPGSAPRIINIIEMFKATRSTAPD